MPGFLSKSFKVYGHACFLLKRGSGKERLISQGKKEGNVSGLVVWLALSWVLLSGSLTEKHKSTVIKIIPAWMLDVAEGILMKKA